MMPIMEAMRGTTGGVARNDKPNNAPINATFTSTTIKIKKNQQQRKVELY